MKNVTEMLTALDIALKAHYPGALYDISFPCNEESGYTFVDIRKPDNELVAVVEVRPGYPQYGLHIITDDMGYGSGPDFLETDPINLMTLMSKAMS